MSPEFVRARLNTFMLQDYVKLCRWASTLRRFESTTIFQSVGNYSLNDRALHSTRFQTSQHHCKNPTPYLLFLKTPAL